MGYYATERLIEKAQWLGYFAWRYCEPGTAYLSHFTLVLEKNGNRIEFTNARDAMEYLNNAQREAGRL